MKEETVRTYQRRGKNTLRRVQMAAGNVAAFGIKLTSIWNWDLSSLSMSRALLVLWENNADFSFFSLSNCFFRVTLSSCPKTGFFGRYIPLGGLRN